VFSRLWGVGGDDVGWEAGFDAVGCEPVPPTLNVN